MIVQDLVSLLTFRVDPNGLRGFDNAVDRVENRIRGLSSILGTAAGVLIAHAVQSAASAIGQAGQFLVQSGDGLIQTGNRVRAAIEDLGEAQSVIEGIYSDAQETGIQMHDTANTFARIAPALRVAGMNSQEALRFIGGLQRGLLVSGATVGETASTVRQLSQAFNSGVLRGDEFNSLMENGGKIVRVFAEEMGVSVGRLREMAEAGQLTNARITGPLSRAFERMRSEFGGIEITVELASARMGIRLRRLAADFMTGFGVTAWITTRLGWLSEWMERVRQKIPPLAASFREFGGINRLIELLGLTIVATFGVAFVRNMAAATAAIFRLGAAFALATLKSTLLLGAIAGVVLLLDDLRVWMQGGDSFLGEQLGPFGEFMDSIGPRFRQALSDAFGPRAITAFDDLMGAIDALKTGLDAIKAFLSLEWLEAWNLATSAVTMFFSTTAGPLAAFLVSLYTVVRLLGAARVAAGAAATAGAAGAAAGAVAPSVLSRLAPAGGLLARFGGPLAGLLGAGYALSTLGENSDNSPGAEASRRLNFGQRGSGVGFYGQSLEDLERSLENSSVPPMASPSSGSQVMAPITNETTINIEVTATAPNADEIAAALRGQIPSITEAINDQLNQTARRLGDAIPRMEAPAQ